MYIVFSFFSKCRPHTILDETRRHVNRWYAIFGQEWCQKIRFKIHQGIKNYISRIM